MTTQIRAHIRQWLLRIGVLSPSWAPQAPISPAPTPAPEHVPECVQPPPDAPAAPDPKPIDMLLHCPTCGLQHIDRAEGCKVGRALGNAWTNPPHRSHLCRWCGCIWRPADVATNGVARIQTAGKADTWIASWELAEGGCTSAALSVLKERRRQIEVEGWSPTHDSTHDTGELAVAASVYADPEPAMHRDPRVTVPVRWPTGWEYKPKDYRSNLVRAAALLIAELERLDRGGPVPPHSRKHTERMERERYRRAEAEREHKKDC